MQYYDLDDRNYHNNQNTNKTRIPYPDGTIKDLYEMAKNGERVNINNLELNEKFDKSIIEKSLLYLELKYLVAHNGDQVRIDEIKLILNPPQDEEELNGNDTY